MLDMLMSLIAPHHCCGCGIGGTVLCEGCKYDIFDDPFVGCVSCGARIAGPSGICKRCSVSYARAWCVADRRSTIQNLIGDYKFNNARNAHRMLAELLNDRLPELPANVVFVPVPTVSSHIRERGYDHMFLIAKRLSRLRNLPIETALQRKTNTKQRDATARERNEQAKEAFQCSQVLDSSKIYLIIDDVITTGATVKYASKALIVSGAKDVWVASISRQPLD